MKHVCCGMMVFVVGLGVLWAQMAAGEQCKGNFDGDNTISIAELKPGPRFVDNGDGTVTDTQTGLMWEKKTDDDTVHDKDSTYTWGDHGDGDESDPDGTAFTDFLGELNDCLSSDKITVTGGFAGYCDWRLPDIVELQTILLEPYRCGTSPCIDPIFGPTQSGYYWSSTTYVLYPRPWDGGAWDVSFKTGGVYIGDKRMNNYVRAVRGGL